MTSLSTWNILRFDCTHDFRTLCPEIYHVGDHVTFREETWTVIHKGKADDTGYTIIRIGKRT